MWGNVILVAGPQFSILIKKIIPCFRIASLPLKMAILPWFAGAQINLKMLRIYGRYNIGMQNINDIDQKTSGPSADSVGVGI